MVEKLSVDFVRKIFWILTNGNAQIKFHTICMQNRDREKATNRPVEFGLKLLGYNLWYRLPLLREIPIGRQIGKDYLTRQYLRLPVEDLASEILENPQAVCDVENSLFLPVLSQDAFFEKLENVFDCPGFAKMRRRYQDNKKPLKDIYDSINQALSTSLSWEQELSIARENLIPNRYIIRFLDIATYHQVAIYLTVDSCYPRCFFETLLKQNDISWDYLAVSCESGKSKTEIARTLGLSKFGIVSADFNGFLKPLSKLGGKPIYYRAPVQLMKDTLHPGLSADFQETYDAICGARVFSGSKRPEFLYELGYLCVGPLFSSVLSFIEGDFTVCYAKKHSLFAKAAGPRAVCTMNPNRQFQQPYVQVLDPGFDEQGFAKFMDTLRRNHPHTQFRVLSLPEITSQNMLCLAGLFTGEKSLLSDGVWDFYRDYTRYTQNAPVPLQDGVRLYRSGCQNVEKLMADVLPAGRAATAISL